MIEIFFLITKKELNEIFLVKISFSFYLKAFSFREKKN